MRLNKLCKQVLSVALAAALAVGTPIAVGPQTVKAETTTDTTVTAPTPLLALDFENGTLTDGKYTEEDVEFTAVGSPSITIDPNNSGNKVLALSEDSNGAKGTEYLSSTLGALGKGKFDKGFTISMSVRPNAITAASADWTYMWGAGHKAGDSADKNAEYSYIDCAAGMIARYGDVKNSLETPDATGFVTKSIQLFPGNNYVDGNPLNAGNTVERNRYNYFFGKDQPGVGKWSTLTFVYSKSEIALYVNGIKTVKWTVRKEYESDVERIIKSISTGRLNLGTSANGFDYSACFSGYMDDVKVFDGALTAEEIAALIPKVESVKIKAEGSTAEGTEKDPVVVHQLLYGRQENRL